METNVKIQMIRQKLKFTQAQMAHDLKIAESTYRAYENGKYFPRPEMLRRIAQAFGLPVHEIIGDDITSMMPPPPAPAEQPTQTKTGLFNADRMYTYLKGYFAAKNWADAQSALIFAHKAHKGQMRKSGEPYIVHPLTMSCHAITIGLDDEPIAVACLLHDVCEDCGVDWTELPIKNPDTKDAIHRLTHTKPDPLDIYYREIEANTTASIVKLIDRCDNVSTMAGVFKTGKLLDYIEETRVYVMPLWRKTKDKCPQYAAALFVLKYHIASVINGLDACVKDDLHTLFTPESVTAAVDVLKRMQTVPGLPKETYCAALPVINYLSKLNKDMPNE